MRAFMATPFWLVAFSLGFLSELFTIITIAIYAGKGEVRKYIYRQERRWP